MQAEFLLEREKNTQLDIYTRLNQSYRVHFHSHIEVCLVLDGELEVWIRNQHRLLRKGQLSVAWSYDPHGYQTPTHSEVLSIIIPPRLFQEFLPRLQNRHNSTTFLFDPELFQSVYDWSMAAQKSNDDLIRKGYIYLILGALMKNVDFERTTAQVDQHLTSLTLMYLSEHFREPLDLGAVSYSLGYHPSHLSHMFKSTLQISFSQYLNLLRLRESMLLMQEGKKSITECAFESGFQSLRTFYRIFRDTFGCTPREYATKNHAP